MAKTVVVTGSNRGIGLEFVKQFSELGDQIFACCRQPEQAKDLLQLAQKNPRITLLPLDVTDLNSIQHLAKALVNQPIDWLINNAGTSGQSGVTIGNIDSANFLNVFHTNCLGAIQVADALLPNLRLGKEKLLLNISSRMGSISDNTSGRSYAYRSSKAALNAVMRSFAIDVADEGIYVGLFHPGWVSTDMGGQDAPVTAQEAVTGMLQVVSRKKNSMHAICIHRFDGGTINF